MINIGLAIWPTIACACQQKLPEPNFLMMAFATELTLAIPADLQMFTGSSLNFKIEL